MDDKISNNAMVYQMAMVLNFCRSVPFLLAEAEPMVKTTMATSITAICSIPKKRICRSCTALLKLCRKYCTSGLMKYNPRPSNNCTCAMVAVMCFTLLSKRENKAPETQPLYARKTAYNRLINTSQRVKEWSANKTGYILHAVVQNQEGTKGRRYTKKLLLMLYACLIYLCLCGSDFCLKM